MANVLVVGGTGMLDEVSRFLASSNNHVCVIPRTDLELQKLFENARDFGGRIIPVKIDFRDLVTLKAQLEKVIRENGPFTLALSWIQAAEDVIHRIIAELINTISPVCRYFHIRQGGPENGNSVVSSETFRDFDKILYREISLGYKMEGNRQRWLTNSEICDGIVDAIREDRSQSVVGIRA